MLLVSVTGTGGNSSGTGAAGGSGSPAAAPGPAPGGPHAGTGPSEGGAQLQVWRRGGAEKETVSDVGTREFHRGQMCPAWTGLLLITAVLLFFLECVAYMNVGHLFVDDMC